ncbi:glycosyltransferase [Alistipes sp.]|uniref:glycosyltransferase n=1 Tax=Alistipes sp. TaxID=1872444 RepID=UPI003AF1B2B9
MIWPYLRMLRHKRTRKLLPRLLHDRFHAGKVTDFRQIPIIINNYNRLEYPRRLIDYLTARGYDNIYIIDNHSTYPPLLKWYAECPFNVIRLKENVGYLSFNKTAVHKMFADQYFVYTDPDVLPAEECPDDFLEYFYRLLQRYPEAAKVGFSLKIDDLPDHFADKKHVIAWESRFWEKPVEPDVYEADIDTTFALYRPNFPVGSGRWGMRLRTGGRYTARHLPWYIDSEHLSEEERYYQSSVKTAAHWSGRVAEADRPLVTVCIPTYNQERWIGDAIQGALDQQTTFRVEILVSDDASTDGTLAVCKHYAERFPDRVRVVSNAQNLGMLANYEKLYRSVETRYIAFCDGDDYWLDPLKLQRQVDYLESNIDCGMCFAKAKTYWVKEQRYKVVYGEPYRQLKDILRICYVPALTAICRTSLVHDYYDDPQMTEIRKACPVTADYPMWLYIGLRARIHFQDNIVAVFRVFENSGSHFDDLDRTIRFDQTICRMADRFIPLYMQKYKWKRTDIEIYRIRLRRGLKDWFRTGNPLYRETYRHYFGLLPATDWYKYAAFARYWVKSRFKRMVSVFRPETARDRD